MVTFNPATNPFKSKVQEHGMYGMKPQQQGGENPMYGMKPETGGSGEVGGVKTASSQNASFKGAAFENFSVPEANNTGNSFMKTGALGEEQAMFGQGNDRLGAKLNLFA